MDTKLGLNTYMVFNNGKKIPVLGLGTWKSKPGEVEAAVKKALEVGYRHIDCAHAYGNEGEVGRALKFGMEKLKIPRKDLFITSKLWNTFHQPEDVEPAFSTSLKNLGLDYLDLYLIHWPIGFKKPEDITVNMPKDAKGDLIYDPVHPTETYLAVEKLVEKGLCKSIGLSNFNAAQIEDVLKRGKIFPVTNQVECHPYWPQDKLKKFCESKKIYLTAYSPLGSPDRPWAATGDPSLLEDSKLAEIAKKHNKSAAQILIRWQIQRGVIVIPKSVTPSRIVQNSEVFDFELTADDMKVISSFARPDGRLIVPMQDGQPRDGKHPHFPFHDEF